MGENGLEHINRQAFARIYGVDINENYLSAWNGVLIH